MHRNSFIAGMAAGAALTFILDPQSGRRRRALVRDQFVRAGHKTRDAADAAAKDLSNRAQGVVAETRSMLRTEHVEPHRLVERVRATLGRATAHPGAIDVFGADAGAMVVAYDRKQRGLWALTIDPETLAIRAASRGAFGTQGEVTGICTYRSAPTGD